MWCMEFGFQLGFSLTVTVSEVRLIADSKLAVGVNASMNDCLSLHVSSVIDWRPV